MHTLLVISPYRLRRSSLVSGRQERFPAVTELFFIKGECSTRSDTNVISTEVRVLTRTQWRNPLRLSPDNDTVILFSTLFVGFADGRAVRPRTAA